MAHWNQETALAELDRRLEEMQGLVNEGPHAAAHMQWLMGTTIFLREVFGEASLVYRTFVRLRWTYSGSMVVHVSETFTPEATQQRYNQPVYLGSLQTAFGLLLAAKEELLRKGLEDVYEGKNTGPEASLLLQVINVAAVKLRKTVRQLPTKEREVQDAFENLLIGADIPYSREKESIEYSSKTYIPDFTVQKADLAIDVKLSTAPAHEKEFIAQISDDILAYRTAYGNLFFIVYDCGHIRDVDRFISSFESQGAVYVRVVKH